MATPSDTMLPWVKTAVEFAPLLASVVTYFVGRAHQKGADDFQGDTNNKRLDKLTDTVKVQGDMLLVHQNLHNGYISMQQDVRTTRDCVNRIAGKLGIDGTK